MKISWSLPLLLAGTFCLGAAGLVVGGLYRQGASQAEEPAIRSILTMQQEAWNRGDLRAFMNGYWNSPDLTFAASKGFTRGWQPVLERYEKTYSDRAAMGKLDFSDLEVRPLGPNAALVLGHWHLQRQIGDIGGIFTLVLQKFPDGWHIVHDHTTQSPPPPVAK